jgi:hypothetical protein
MCENETVYRTWKRPHTLEVVWRIYNNIIYELYYIYIYCINNIRTQSLYNGIFVIPIVYIVILILQFFNRLNKRTSIII